MQSCKRRRVRRIPARSIRASRAPRRVHSVRRSIRRVTRRKLADRRPHGTSLSRPRIRRRADFEHDSNPVQRGEPLLTDLMSVVVKGEEKNWIHPSTNWHTSWVEAYSRAGAIRVVRRKSEGTRRRWLRYGTGTPHRKGKASKQQHYVRYRDSAPDSSRTALTQ